MVCIDLNQNLLQAWEALGKVLNSAFISAFLSALAGAGFGVWGAQKLAQRSLRRKELFDAMRQANGLVVLASTISNQALSMKSQHVDPLSKSYFEQRRAAEATNEVFLRGATPEAHMPFKAEMIHITPLTVPVEALKSLTYSAQLIPGRALALVAMVEQSLTELDHAVRMRSGQIDSLKAGDAPVELFVQNYFGLRRKDGSVDSLFHDSMLAIMHYTDDVAFFGAELAEEIQLHAARVRGALVKIAKDVPQISTVDFSKSRASGLMPAPDRYLGWLSGFKTQS